MKSPVVLPLKHITVFVLLSIGTSALYAQSPTCNKGFITLDEAVENAKKHAWMALSSTEPLNAPSAVQNAAPSSQGSATVVDRAGFSNLLSLALDNNLISSKDGAYTINLSPFALVGLARPQVLFDQEEYSSPMSTALRRFGATVSFGGKGESFDRDGDGKNDPALEAKNLGDIFTWEARLRLIGSRDRRERFDTFDKLVGKAFSDALDAEALLRIMIGDDALNTARQTDNQNCFQQDSLNSILAKPENRESLAAAAQADQEIKKDSDAALKEIDNSFILTFVASGTERRKDFGTDKKNFALRSSFGNPKKNHTQNINLEWFKTNGLLGKEDVEGGKLGYEYSFLWLKNTSVSKGGIDVGLSGSYEKLKKAPIGMHDDNSKVNLKLSFPITDGVTVPISVTWANHTDLLTDTEKEISGHVGFTIDLSKLTDRIKK